MAKSDSMKKEINKFLYFYRFLATAFIMWHKMRKIVIMVNKGLISIQLDNKQDYKKFVPKNANELSRKNWTNLGFRLRKAMGEVTK